MGHQTPDMEGAVHGKYLAKGAKARPKEGIVPDDPEGVQPKDPSLSETLRGGKETADHGVESNPRRPEQSKPQDQDR